MEPIKISNFELYDIVLNGDQEEIDSLVFDKGFRDNWSGQGINYISDRIVLEDMHPANVFVDEVSSRAICIDCIVKFVSQI